MEQRRYPRVVYRIPKPFKRKSRVYDKYTYDKGRVIAGGISTAKHVHVLFSGRLKRFGPIETACQRLRRYKKGG